MGSVSDYIRKYGNMSFSEKRLTDIDACILSCIPYYEFGDIVPNDKKYIALYWALREINTEENKKIYNTRNYTQKEMFNLIPLLMKYKRYRNILLFNYEYKVTFDEQFSAISMKLDDGTIFVAFEGTDNNICGWEEDTKLVYQYPNQCQLDATKYLDRSITLFDKKVYVGGHSKGGHLAIMASMMLNFFDRDKIINIYSFDGLGLRKENINSLKYKKIENKLKLITSNYTLVSMLLRHSDDLKIVKSSKKGFYAHCPLYWEVEGEKFVSAKLSSLSKKLGDSVSKWLDDHDDRQRRKMCEGIFSIFRECGITKTNELTKAKNLIKIVSLAKNLDEETVDILKSFVKYNIDNIRK